MITLGEDTRSDFPSLTEVHDQTFSSPGNSRRRRLFDQIVLLSVHDMQRQYKWRWEPA
jgi:hypothetical protein